MQIKLNQDDLDYIAAKIENSVTDKIMKAILSSAGYEIMVEQVKKWVNMHTDEDMVRRTMRDTVEENVKKEVGAFFSNYASGDKKALVAPVREAIHVAAVEQIKDIVNRIGPVSREVD